MYAGCFVLRIICITLRDKTIIMKNLLLLLVLSSSLTVSRAQVKYGGKIGLNLSDFTGDEADEAKSKVGFNFGGFAEIPVADAFAVKPELVFSKQGAKTEITSVDSKFKLSYINIPVLVKYNTSSGFFVETGPQVGFLVSAKVKADNVLVDVKDQFKTTDFSWAFGLGYDIIEYDFGVNLRYNLGLVNIADGGNSDLKNSVFQLGVYKTFGTPGAANPK